MGAELITYILVGPVTLSKRRIPKAIKHINKLLADENFAFQDTFDCTHEEVIELFQTTYGGEASKLVEALFEAWSGDFRDVNNRLINPRDPKSEKILVAGDTTWGDSPDGGAYQALTYADRFGLFELFGIH